MSGPVDIQAGTLGLVGSGTVAGAVRVADPATLRIATSTLWQPTSSRHRRRHGRRQSHDARNSAPGDSTVGSLAIDGQLHLPRRRKAIELAGFFGDQFYRSQDHPRWRNWTGSLRRRSHRPGGGQAAAGRREASGSAHQQAGISGGFADLLLPTLELGLGWQLDTPASTALLSVATVPSFTADFDLDGDVDADDLTPGMRDFGGPGADADDDGDTDGADFFAWQKQFGSSPAPGFAAAGAIPEPASASLFWGLVLLGNFRRRLLRGYFQP